MLTALLACADPGTPVDPDPVPAETVASLPAPRPAPAQAAVPWVDEAEVPSLDDPAGWIFDTSVVHTLSIELDSAGRDALFVDPYTAVPAEVVFDGVRVAGTGVRLKGKIGSFRDLDGKASFKIDFGELVPGGEFWSLEKLVVNGNVVDCTHLRTTMGYRVFALAGLPSLRTGFATVEVGGEPYGLYTLVENPDEPWVERGYPEHPDGNLYDGKYIWHGGWSYTLLDFEGSVQDMFELEEGVDVGHADIHAVTAAADLAGTPEFYAAAGEVVDWDELHTYWAVEQWIGHVDGYAMNQNNYWAYFDPSDGKMDMHPWDLDYAFIQDYWWGMSWAAPRGRLAAACWADEACMAGQRAAVAELLTALDAVDLVAEHDAAAAVIEANALDDPRRECGSWNPEELRPWLASQSEALRVFWGL